MFPPRPVEVEPVETHVVPRKPSKTITTHLHDSQVSEKEERGEDVSGRKAIVQALSTVQKIVPVRPPDTSLEERIILGCVSCVLSPILQKDNLRLWKNCPGKSLSNLPASGANT